MNKVRNKMIINLGFLSGMQKSGELSPRELNMLYGAVIGGVPGSIYGLMRASEKDDKYLKNAIKYGLLGGGLGAGAGYLFPIPTRDMPAQLMARYKTQMEPTAQVDLTSNLKDYLAVLPKETSLFTRFLPYYLDIPGVAEEFEKNILALSRKAPRQTITNLMQLYSQATGKKFEVTKNE